MRRYESIVIIDTETSEDKRKLISTKINDFVTRDNGLMIEIQEWGIKKLAYEIRKKTHGYYFRFDFCSKSKIIQEIEYFFGINDSVLKFMTIVMEKKVNLEAIKKSLEESKELETESKELETNDNVTELKNSEEHPEISKENNIVDGEE